MDIRYIEVEVERLKSISEQDGVVIFRERFAQHNKHARRFIMGFQHQLLVYMEIARRKYLQYGELLGHGAVMLFYEDNSNMRLDHIIIDMLDDEERYEMICYGTTPKGTFSRKMLPSDAISMGLSAGISFWMKDELLIKASEKSHDTLTTLDCISSKESYDPFDDLEDIPDEDLPQQ